MPTATVAHCWLERWDRQQELYVADREERFAVVIDVVATASGRPDPVVIDLGAGPGSLSVRLLDRLPDARVVAVDADPLLLGLARAAYGDRAGLHIVERDLRETGWVDALALDGPVDAVVSTTALHWLTRDELGAVYRELARVLRPGGVFVNGDHSADGAVRPRLDRLARAVRDGRAARVGVLDNEDWATWWDAVAADEDLRDLTATREPRPIDHSVAEPVTVDGHLALLADAGFAEIGTVWQHGDDRVIVGVR